MKIRTFNILFYTITPILFTGALLYVVLSGSAPPPKKSVPCENILVATKNNTANFWLNNDIYLMVFWTDWCKSCGKNLADLCELDIPILLIDIDTEFGAIFAKEYEIRTIPTMTLMRNGEIIHTWEANVKFEMPERYLENIHTEYIEHKELRQ